MGRRGLGALTTAAWLLAVPVCAQVVKGNAPTPGITIHRPDPPRQNPPAPPPRTNVPHHPPHQHVPLPRHDDDRDLFRARPHTYAPRYTQRVPIPFYGYPIVYPYVVDGYVPPAPAGRTAPPMDAAAPTGYLRLQIEPRSAHVFIDRFFVGAVEDLPSRFPLEPGPHRIEIRADGFETVTVDVRVRPYETLTFTKELGRIAPGPARSTAPVAAVAAKTLYVIPRCYGGDKPPVASDLPAGCSVDALRTIAPATP